MNSPRSIRASWRLLEACGRGNPRLALEALAQGADPNHRDESGRPCLGAAAEAGREECVALLLGAGADPLALDRMGRPPLALAASRGERACARLLCGFGAEIVADRQGRTPLMMAALYGDLACVEAIAPGSDLRARCADGHRAVDIARFYLPQIDPRTLAFLLALDERAHIDLGAALAPPGAPSAPRL